MEPDKGLEISKIGYILDCHRKDSTFPGRSVSVSVSALRYSCYILEREPCHPNESLQRYHTQRIVELSLSGNCHFVGPVS